MLCIGDFIPYKEISKENHCIQFRKMFQVLGGNLVSRSDVKSNPKDWKNWMRLVPAASASCLLCLSDWTWRHTGQKYLNLVWFSMSLNFKFYKFTFGVKNRKALVNLGSFEPMNSWKISNLTYIINRRKCSGCSKCSVGICSASQMSSRTQKIGSIGWDSSLLPLLLACIAWLTELDVTKDKNT